MAPRYCPLLQKDGHSQKNIRFVCDYKGPKFKELGLSLFVDDGIDVLTSCWDKGRDLIEEHQGRLIHFAKGGGGNGPESSDKTKKLANSAKEHYTTARNWAQVLERLRGRLLERRVTRLLDEICSAKRETQLDQIDLKHGQELKLVVKIILERACAEPHRRETFADIVLASSIKYPEFSAEREGEKAQKFKDLLVNICLTEFESLSASFEPIPQEKVNMQDDDMFEIKTKFPKKDRMFANMKFIGDLFLKKLLPLQVIGRVVYGLIGMKVTLPEEHEIECVCEFLEAIRHRLDQDIGRKFLPLLLLCLKGLKQSATPDGKAMLSERMQCKIQSVFERFQKTGTELNPILLNHLPQSSGKEGGQNGPASGGQQQTGCGGQGSAGEGQQGMPSGAQLKKVNNKKMEKGAFKAVKGADASAVPPASAGDLSTTELLCHVLVKKNQVFDINHTSQLCQSPNRSNGNWVLKEVTKGKVVPQKALTLIIKQLM